MNVPLLRNSFKFLCTAFVEGSEYFSVLYMVDMADLERRRSPWGGGKDWRVDGVLQEVKECMEHRQIASYSSDVKSNRAG